MLVGESRRGLAASSPFRDEPFPVFLRERNRPNHDRRRRPAKPGASSSAYVSSNPGRPRTRIDIGMTTSRASLVTGTLTSTNVSGEIDVGVGLVIATAFFDACRRFLRDCVDERFQSHHASVRARTPIFSANSF